MTAHLGSPLTSPAAAGKRFRSHPTQQGSVPTASSFLKLSAHRLSKGPFQPSHTHNLTGEARRTVPQVTLAPETREGGQRLCGSG